jgi:hypothetical protein
MNLNLPGELEDVVLTPLLVVDFLLVVLVVLVLVEAMLVVEIISVLCQTISINGA